MTKDIKWVRLGFFANGMFSAINWDQVARLQQITVYESAKNSFGVNAWQNNTQGRAVKFIRHFPPALGRSFNRRFGHVVLSVAQSLTLFLHPKGQVIYYCQAVGASKRVLRGQERLARVPCSHQHGLQDL